MATEGVAVRLIGKHRAIGTARKATRASCPTGAMPLHPDASRFPNPFRPRQCPSPTGLQDEVGCAVQARRGVR